MKWVAALLAAAAVFVWSTPTVAATRLRRQHVSATRFDLGSIPRPWRRAEPRARDVATLATALAAELRAGRSPTPAWDAVVTAWTGQLPGPWVPGAAIPVVLRRWARSPGWSGLTAIAICWQLADETGSGLAEALDRVAETMRHEHEIVTEVQSQLSGVRATAAVLATLPFVSLGMGTLLGANPLAMLVGTSLGRVCLAAGVVLALTGWWWLTSQVTSVQRSLRW